jgi:hypothetical protein
MSTLVLIPGVDPEFVFRGGGGRFTPVKKKSTIDFHLDNSKTTPLPTPKKKRKEKKEKITPSRFDEILFREGRG